MTARSATLASSTLPRAETLRAAAVALLIGSGLLFAVGFAHVPALHDVAHDTRHANGFPCH